MYITYVLLISVLIGSAPDTLGIIIDVQTSNCDPPLHRNASSSAQVISIKPSTKIACTWVIHVDDDNCLEIYANDGADLVGASLSIEDGSSLEIRPFVNTTLCSSHQVNIYYRHNVSSVRVPGTNMDLYFQAVPARGHTAVNDVRTTTTSIGSTDDGGGSSPAVIAVAVIIPLLLISIGACIFYVWYRRKYPVRMIMGKDFGKFSNPVYNKRASTATLVREGASVDDYQSDIEVGAAYTGVAHDNPALNMEDDPQYQPIPAMTQSFMSYSKYRRSFDDSPKLEKKAPEKPRRIYTSNQLESEDFDDKTGKDGDHVTEDSQSAVSQHDTESTKGQIKTDESSPVYENVETNFIEKANMNETASEMTSGEIENDVSPKNEEPSRGFSSEYEDVLPTEDEHTYDIALQKSEKSGCIDVPSDDSQIYENLSISGEKENVDKAHTTVIDNEQISINGQNQSHIGINEQDESHSGTNKQDESHSGTNKRDDLQNEGCSDDSSSVKSDADHELQNSSQPTDPQIQESLYDESFVVPDKSGPSGIEIRKTEDLTEQNRTQETTHLENGSLEDVRETLQDQSIIVHDDSHAGNVESVDRSFEVDENLNISVSLISDPDGKSFDSASSFVSHELKSIEESSDPFEVSTSTENIKDETSISTNEKTEVTAKENLREEHSDIQENAEQTSSLAKTIKPDLNISFQDSSESEASDNEDEVRNEETSSNRTGERRESLTRKIAIDRGGISFDDSSTSSVSDASDVEDIKPTVNRRESITLGNPTFDPPNVNESLTFMPDETLDKSEQPRGLERRVSITLDDPLFAKDSEITSEPEVFPANGFQVIEAELQEKPIIENETVDKSPLQQRKVLKINIDIDNDDLDSDGVSADSEVDSNSDPDSSTEA